MDFPRNSSLVKKLVVADQLHVAAIDFMFLDLAPCDCVTIRGITKKNDRWILSNDIHSINYGNDNYGRSCYIHAARDNDMFTLEFSGDEPLKSINKILSAKRIKVINESFIREIDMFVMKEKSMEQRGGYVVDVVRIPMNNIYSFNKQTEKGYMILQKELVDDKISYTIDIVGTYYNSIIDSILNGNADRVRVVVCSVISDNIFVRSMEKMPPENMYPSQEKIINFIINAYSTNNKNVTVLISGSSGCGKSTVALWLAQIMKRRLSVDPYLIKGFNLNCKEMQYHPIINHYSPKNNSPVILLLDEFDVAMNNTNNDNGGNGNDNNNNNNYNNYNNNAIAISANKTNMNNFLDSINDEQYLITIATTNMTLNNINKHFAVYCRYGRFNKHFEIKSKDVVEIVDPPFS